MRRLLFIMALLLLAGCHSQRHSTEHTEAAAYDSIEAHGMARVESSADFLRILMALCDSVAVRFRADSIRTPTGVLYGPALNADITAPRVVAAHAAEVDSTAAGIVAVNESRQRGDNEQQRELTAVARPGAGTIILWLLAAAALATVLYWLRHKIRNPP